MSNRQQLYTNVENAPAVYVNSVQIAQTPFDLRMMMGVLEVATDERVVTRVAATVFMSPQHAKVFAHILNKHIAKYEATHGAIPLAHDSASELDDESILTGV